MKNGKSNWIIINPSIQPSPQDILCSDTTVNNITIPLLNTVKYLDLNLDKRLTWNNHIKSKRITLNFRAHTLKVLLIKNKFTKINIKLQIHKALLKSIWTYGLQFWGPAKKTNLNKIQTFQNITLHKITNIPPYVSNLTLHKDLRMKIIKDAATLVYRRFFSKLKNHQNP